MTSEDRRHETDIELLQRIIARQEAIIERLSVSSAFGCLTRPALDLLLEGMPLDGLAVVFWDIDGLNLKNKQWGKPESSRRIKEAVAARSTDCVAGQVFSGDEFIAFPLVQDAIPMAERIQAHLHSLEMSATFYITLPHPGETPKELLERVDSGCAFWKDRGQRDAIHLGYGME